VDEQKYSPAFLRAVAFILPHEEEFVRNHWGDDSREEYVLTENVPGDRGSTTRYGIDARSHPGVDVANLTRQQAIDIYFEEWRWRNMDSLPAKLAVCCFDVFVNGGFPIRWLQTAINRVGFSVAQTDLKLPLAVDGDLGPHTIAAAWACDQQKVLWFFINERDGRFRALAAANPQDRKFLSGWEQRDTDLIKFLAA
jgi:lysozyme family protein